MGRPTLKKEIPATKHRILLRCHTSVPETKKEPKDHPRDPQWPKHVLVLDAETTTDVRQSLNFGAYRFCRAGADGKYVCIEEGLFHAHDLDEPQLEILRRYAQARTAETQHRYPQRLRLFNRSVFMEEVFLRAVHSNAAIVAFNLPFDLSRLAVEYRIGHRADGRGWSFILFNYYDRKKRKLRPNTFRPRAQLIPKNSKAAFIRLVGGDRQQVYKPGRFLDLKTLVWALRNKNLSLESACREFNVPGKIDHTPMGSPGRPTLSDGDLIERRNAWAYLLQTRWGEIGWQLKCARSRDKIQAAFQRIVGGTSEYLAATFARVSRETATSASIRKVKKELGEALSECREVEGRLNAQRQSVQDAERAVFELSDQNRKQVEAELSRREANVRDLKSRASKQKTEVREKELTLKISRGRSSCCTRPRSRPRRSAL